MPRIASLNLNHRTRPVAVAQTLLDGLLEHQPDIIIFNEFVNQPPANVLPKLLKIAGFPYCAISDSVEYRTGRWHNQILIASRNRILASTCPHDGPDDLARTNTLTVRTFDLSVTGLRVPAYKSARDWYRYWEWMTNGLTGDVAIGDFNADPDRERKRDRVLEALVEKGGWTQFHIESDWSYRGNNGCFSKVDYVLSRGTIRVDRAWYVTDTYVTSNTDHAAIFADLTPTKKRASI